MSTITWVKLAIAVVGITIWAYGFRQEDSVIRWIGIAVIAMAALMRFYRPRPRGPVDRPPPG